MSGLYGWSSSTSTQGNLTYLGMPYVADCSDPVNTARSDPALEGPVVT